MSASEFRIPYQQVASSQSAENAGQFKICRCGEGDTSETGDSPTAECPNCQLAQNGAMNSGTEVVVFMTNLNALLVQILKSGHLLLSSRGIGWTTWKKRWFILTRGSLVFFRSDPNQPARGNEPVVTLGGIDLNNSGSVVVKEDRKLLTVFFPDGREGRTFTLKAETTEELNDWRSALENALAQAPSVANTLGQNPIFSTEGTDPADASAEQLDDKSSVIGRPAEFALIDPDGSPSFLEKALKFIEDYGVKVEGILRQSADVEEVKRRFQDYENGKNEFSPEEDAHVIGDCIKCILREMPSSPVPATCCTTLFKAYRADKSIRNDEMNRVLYEVFPEPNRHLLQRILKMMQVVGSHKAVNRMSPSALAACMAPLLLRPLLLGECEIDGDFSMAGDGSFQLLQAAAAANHAQAIVIILHEEHDDIFDDLEEGSCSYTESDDGDVDNDEDGSYASDEDDIEEDLDDDNGHSSGGGERERNSRIHVTHDKAVQHPSEAARIERGVSREDIDRISSVPQVDNASQMESINPSHRKQESCESNASTDHVTKSNSQSSSSRAKFADKSSSSENMSNKRTLWGRTSARKDLSTDDNECSDDDEALIEKLENNKIDLHSKISKEVKENATLQASLEKRKEALHVRRLALEKEVENLRDQLQKERNLRASLESGLMNLRRGPASFSPKIDSKTKADLEEVAAAEADILSLKQKACDLRGQLNNQVQLSPNSLCESCRRLLLNKSNVVNDEQPAALSTEVSSSLEASSIVAPNSISDIVSAARMADIEQSKEQTTHHSPSSTDKLASNNQPNTSSVSQGAQIMPSSKSEDVMEDSQEGSLASRWNFVQRQYSNSPLLSRIQAANAVASTRTGESGAAPSLGLAKLTNRLNFLKERRALLASEMQNLYLARPPGPTAPSANGGSR